MYILVLAALLKFDAPPQMVAPFGDLDACLVAAGKRNHSDPALKTKEAREMGAAYVCMKMVYPV